MDADSDFATTCDGDCNDNDPFTTYECYGGGSPDQECAAIDPNYEARYYNCLSLGGAIWYGYPQCQCSDPSPILIDVLADGFALTDRSGGVAFDINADGTPDNIPWTVANTDDAWLVFDRNGNGTIDDGKELFGNFTPQPPSNEPNGFLALAEFDKSSNGGNGDGVIDGLDSIYEDLRLWRDTNHNGVSESSELFTLPSLNVRSLSLDYKESRRTDKYGNVFRFRAKVQGADGAHLGRWAYDVFFVSRK